MRSTNRNPTKFTTKTEKNDEEPTGLKYGWKNCVITCTSKEIHRLFFKMCTSRFGKRLYFTYNYLSYICWIVQTRRSSVVHSRCVRGGVKSGQGHPGGVGQITALLFLQTAQIKRYRTDRINRTDQTILNRSNWSNNDEPLEQIELIEQYWTDRTDQDDVTASDRDKVSPRSETSSFVNRHCDVVAVAENPRTFWKYTWTPTRSKRLKTSNTVTSSQHSRSSWHTHTHTHTLS